MKTTAKIIFVVVFLFIASANSESEPGPPKNDDDSGYGGKLECGPNETKNKCGVVCEGTCEDFTAACPKICKPGAKPVCQCKEDFMRDSNGKCIPRVKCPCKKNQAMKECATCEKTCQAPSPVCDKKCRPAQCQCIEGFVRDANDTCIAVKECPAEPEESGYGYGGKECDNHEVSNKCGVKCEGTCANPIFPCPKICKTGKAVCQCAKGYVREEGKCIKTETCPKNCTGPNEEYRKCATCEGTCEKPNPPCILMCQSPKCQCIKDFVRGSDGKCIPESKCPGKCKKENEEFKQCAGCEGTCDDPTPVCTKECKPPKCQCVKDYVRAPDSQCTPIGKNGKCPPKCPGPNEEFMKCATCEKTCETPDPVCTKDCKPSKCQCKSGFARDLNDTCIAVKECPKYPGCDVVKCPGPQACTLVPVPCKKAPCPVVGKCVPVECTPKCPKGQECKKVDVVCVKAPCPPVGECKPKAGYNKGDD